MSNSTKDWIHLVMAEIRREKIWVKIVFGQQKFLIKRKYWSKRYSGKRKFSIKKFGQK